MNLLKMMILFCVLIVVGFSFWVQSRPLVKYRETNDINSVPISIDICVSQNTDTRKIARILDDVWQVKRDIYTRMSNDVAGSDITKVNASYQNPQKISEDTYKLLQQVVRYKELTRGAFDVSMQTLMDLWRRCELEGRMPSEKEILEAKLTARISNLKFLLGNRVEMLNPYMRINLKGVVNGYALDQTIKILHRKGIRNFLIDAGGDMYASGHNCSRKPWTIAIRNPNDRSKIVDVIRVVNLAVATSGGLENGYEILGHRLSHIINPITGVPQKEVASATVIAPLNNMQNDALATALCVLGPTQGMALIDSLGPKYACLIITKDKQGNLVFYKSKNYALYQMKKY